MAYINLHNDLPGIRGLMAYGPHTAAPLNALAEILLRDDHNTLSRGERELIGAYVSYLNDCFFCRNVHGAMAQHYLKCEMKDIDAIKTNFISSRQISEKLKTLLDIAAAVQTGGKQVTKQHIAAARDAGATDTEIHDAVLIAATFCMFNRYVDGLNTTAPQDRQIYIDRAPQNAAQGYAGTDVYQ